MSEPSAAPFPPRGAVAAAQRLASIGAGAWLVGESALGLRRGVHFEGLLGLQLATPAPLARVLHAFPGAVPTRPAEALCALPSLDGPIDVSCGLTLEAHLAGRAFTLHAFAYDLLADEWIDPYGGAKDAECGRLRCVADPDELVARQPLHALRAARWAAELALEPDAALAGALRGAKLDLHGGRAVGMRRELLRTLLAPHAARGLGVMRASGLEAQLAQPVRDDAAAVVSRAPRTLELRLAAWLRGARAAAALRRLRVGMALSTRVLSLLDHHPIDEAAGPRRTAALERLVRRVGLRGVEQLTALREAELAAWEDGAGDAASTEQAARGRRGLASLGAALAVLERRRAVARARETLELDGRAVMQTLGVGPGRRVGQALAHLAEWVADDPERNTAELLSAELAAWDRAQPESGSR